MEQSYWSSAINWMLHLLDEDPRSIQANLNRQFTWHFGWKFNGFGQVLVWFVSGFEDIMLLLVVGLFLFYPR